MDNKDSIEWYREDIRRLGGGNTLFHSVGMAYGKVSLGRVTLALLEKSFQLSAPMKRFRECKFYDNCLTFAADNHAMSFSCERCDIWANSKN